MAINKTAKQRQSDSVVKTLLSAHPAFEKLKKETKLKNFNIDKELCTDYEILCKHIFKSEFTEQIVMYIQEEVDTYSEEIQKIRQILNI